MDEKNFSEQLWGKVGENGFSEQTRVSILKDAYENLPSDETKVEEYLTKKAAGIKTLWGQFNHDVGNTVNAQVEKKFEEFKKNFKPDTQTPPNPQQPAAAIPEEIAKQLEELSEFKKSYEQEKQTKLTEELVKQKKSTVEAKLKEEGADNPEVIEFALMKVSFLGEKTVEDLVKEAKTVYEDKYTKLYGDGFIPGFGSGGNQRKQGTAFISQFKEKLQNEGKLPKPN